MLSVKNGWAWVSMVSHLKEINENLSTKEEKKSLEPLRSCLLNSTAQAIQPISTEIGLDWPFYFAGKS